MSQNNNTYVKKELPANLQKTGIILLLVGVVFGALHFFVDFQNALFSYLLSYMFLVSIGVGALFLVALEYVVNADWSVPIRRVVENVATIVPLLIILAIPLLFNLTNVFSWARPIPSADKVLLSKSPFLNTSFFLIRTAVCIGLWVLFYFILTKNSRKQDETKDQLLTKKNIRYSAIFIPVFALTITMSAIDWMMSLEPHWYSTIFGVYFFSGSVLASLSVVTFATIMLREKGFLHPRMTDDHYYSLGALLFAFINFWAYIAFSQYLLIWYANLPEETFWFLGRYEGGWVVISLALIVIHFLVPYAILLSQPAKMDPKRLKFAAIWILFAHYVDLYWLIMPNMHTEHFSILSVILQFAFPTAAVGIIILAFYYRSKNANMVPVGDPKLEKGLNFKL